MEGESAEPINGYLPTGAVRAAAHMGIDLRHRLRPEPTAPEATEPGPMDDCLNADGSIRCPHCMADPCVCGQPAEPAGESVRDGVFRYRARLMTELVTADRHSEREYWRGRLDALGFAIDEMDAILATLKGADHE